MSSIVIAGDTSGSVTLQAPAVSGSTVLNLPATSGTIQASGAGYTTNGVAFASSTSVLATGSALIFDGTKLALLSSSAAVLESIKSTSSTSQAALFQVNNDADVPFNIGVFGSTAGTFGVLGASTPFISTNASTLNFVNTNASGAIVYGIGSSAAEAMRLNSTGLGIGTTTPDAKLDVTRSGNGQIAVLQTGANRGFSFESQSDTALQIASIQGSTNLDLWANTLSFSAGGSERARIDSSGNLLVGKTATSDAAGCILYGIGLGYFVRSGGNVLEVNRLTNDGTLIAFSQDSTNEGSISVSGTTVSYNGGHLSRWAQTTSAKDDSIVKGTVLSNLDEMNVYTKDGQPVDNEQLNKVKVSDTEGDANVAGVFVNWSHDDAHNVDEINMAMTGDMIIRIAQGVTVVRGDLLMSAGDGTAKPQGDDIVRSKTVAKVTSNHVTCTYADGSYCVPCVLMAC